MTGLANPYHLHKAEIHVVKRQFLTGIKRLEVITGKSCTLLLEVPSEIR